MKGMKMKNKEIEVIEKYLNGLISYPFQHKDKEYILSYIEQLEKKVDQYVNPDDLTLFYMWLDTKAKDKMKQLETEIKEANESVTWWQNRYEAVVKQNDDNHKKVVKLENNRDKAIEEIKYLISNCDISDYQGKKLENILKGDSDE